MGMTVTEKILAAHAGKESVRPGDNIWVDVDVLMTHDVCGPGTIGIFKKQFGENAKVWDREKVVIIPDHYIFTSDKHANRNIDILREFVKEQDLPYYYDVGTENYKGVCHIALAQEGHNRPGEILFGTDSHTCTSGAFGMFSTGIGNTDAAFILGTGKIWLKVPETMRFEFTGTFPPYIMAKDILLQVIGDIGVDGATYRAMEWAGDAVYKFSMEERMTLCNMAIEAGGKNAVIEADDVTLEYLKTRTDKPYKIYHSDADANYYFTKTYKAGEMEPVVAKPHSPDNKALVRECQDVKLDRSYIGSCTGGKLTDFIAAAQLLKGKKVAIETFIVPATREVEQDLYKETLDGETLMDIFKNAGARIGEPSCAACLGGPKDTFGRANAEEVVISTTNRNFPGRMGSKQSQVYLASPYTAAASALTGRITDPREFINS
ncbi:MAG: 3-isopropylmalate dehydratase large subunit [Nitrospinae bacterium]|jgi:3-isopropylmalate/(R)-2-methylmalate dehydratase large subunit|nr:3-isopropylmalate dehydratase large subunit [Nitrospinota bacterium]MDA1109213.1 3-isopropylmalate dehydratase large subunit [Nitrospinota bacterium]